MQGQKLNLTHSEAVKHKIDENAVTSEKRVKLELEFKEATTRDVEEVLGTRV